MAGQNCITEAPADRWNLDAMGTTAHGGFIAGADRFDHALFRLSRDEAVLLAPEVRLFLETAWLTFENAGYGLSRLKDLQRAQPGGTGVFVASMYHEARSADAGQAATDTNLTDWMIANRVSHFFDLGGPSLAINTACSGGLTAIHLACESLRGGSCAMALAGGVNLTLDPSKFATLQRLGLLASGDASKSFGQGDGFLPGEGVGAVLLKPLQRALADGDRIEALILGSQINHSGGRQSFFAPEPKAQARLLVEMFELNVGLATFNLLPIPPLDGSRLLPRSFDDVLARVAPFSFVLLLVVLNVAPVRHVLLEIPYGFLYDSLATVFRLRA